MGNIFGGPKFLRQGESYSGHAQEVLSKALMDEIDGLTDEQLRSASATDQATRMVGPHLVSLPSLKEDQTTFDVVMVPIPHTSHVERQIHYFVPFDGDPAIFSIQSRGADKLSGLNEIRGQEIVLMYRASSNDPNEIKPQFQKDINQIKETMRYLKSDLEDFNSWLKTESIRRIEARLKLISDPDWERELGFPRKKTN